MRWGESDLLDLCKVVHWVLVECKLSDLPQWELTLWPDVGKVVDVDLLSLPQRLGLLGGHSLHLKRPLWKVTLLNSLVQVLAGMVW